MSGEELRHGVVPPAPSMEGRILAWFRAHVHPDGPGWVSGRDTHPVPGVDRVQLRDSLQRLKKRGLLANQEHLRVWTWHPVRTEEWAP